MTQAEQHTVVGIFANSQDARNGIDALLQAGFPEAQLGFAARTQTGQLEPARQQLERHSEQSKHAGGANSLSRGILGGIMGAVDLLLVPFTGPADAAAILGSTLPIAEEAIDKFPYRGARGKQSHEPLQRPDDALRTTQPAPDVAETVQDPTRTVPPTTEPETTSDASETENDTAEEQTEQRHERLTGGVTGGVIGGALGAAAALLLPEVGPIIAGGIIATILGGGAIGSVAGSFLSTFHTMGIPKKQAQHYVDQVQAGNVIVTAQGIEQPQAVVDILRHYQPLDVQIH